MSLSITYPECRTAANGPCQLMSSSETACSSEFGDSSFYERRYCMCTNGYFNRSSESVYAHPSSNSTTSKHDVEVSKEFTLTVEPETQVLYRLLQI